MAEALCKQSPDYEFTYLNGEKVKRTELVQIILGIIGDSAKETKDIAKHIGMAYQPVFSILRALTTADILTSERYLRVTLFRKPNKCGLANLFYPVTMLDNIKIKSSKIYNMNDFPNISNKEYNLYKGFSGNYNNTIYEGTNF